MSSNIYTTKKNEKSFIKKGATPAGCIMNNPYCECPAGSRCKVLPPKLREDTQP